MIEFFHDFLYEKETFENVVMPILIISVIIWLFRD